MPTPQHVARRAIANSFTMERLKIEMAKGKVVSFTNFNPIAVSALTFEILMNIHNCTLLISSFAAVCSVFVASGVYPGCCWYGPHTVGKV